MPRSKRVYKKQKFRGNQYTKKFVEETNPQPRAHQEQEPHVHKEDNVVSSSKKKISYVQKSDLSANINSVNSSVNSNVIIGIDMLSSFVNKNTICRYCKSADSLYISESINNRRGLCSELIMKCKICDANNTTRTSECTRHKYYDINVRLVYGLRCIGKGKKSGDLLCGILNIPPPPSKFSDYTDFLERNLREVAQGSMISAAAEAKDVNGGNGDLTVVVDGTWQRRGHTSHHGVVAATSISTGKILDVEVLSNYCRGCTTNAENHKCVKNHAGKSGSMEAEGAKQIFQRSVRERGVRYTKYLGDGDSKAYKTVCDSKPYGDSVNIEKLECVGHMQKRMGTRLRKIKKEMKGKKMSDGKTLGGQNRLTDAEIDKLQTYYGLAIRRNTEDVEKMQTAVWSIFLHKSSTDDHPQHQLCPKEPDTWCGFHRAIACGEQYHHKHSLPYAVMEVIKPIFRDLSDRNLLQKCLHGHTQNQNESFNNCIWERVPKTVFVGHRIICVGVYDAILTFNNGAVRRLLVFDQMGLKPGANTEKALRRIDNDRLYHAQRATQASTKEARIKRRHEKKQKESRNEDADDYSPGMY